MPAERELTLEQFRDAVAALGNEQYKLTRRQCDVPREIPRRPADGAVRHSEHSHRSGLANDFGQRAIAEGVENRYTADVLRDLGVTYAQGYLFGRPR
jgi:hypothetical protein